MKNAIASLAATTLCFCTILSAYGAYEIENEGTWPQSWPKELEPLRKQARTLTGPMALQPHYEIPFTKREDFESAWPHILKIKSQGAPIILVRGPDASLGTTIKAGVRIYAPPPVKVNRSIPKAPLSGQSNVRDSWMYTTFVELIVDGDVVDLNRIPLPANTPMIDERFKDRMNPSLKRSSG